MNFPGIGRKYSYLIDKRSYYKKNVVYHAYLLVLKYAKPCIMNSPNNK